MSDSTNTQNRTTKTKIHIGDVLMSVIPLLMMLCILTAAQMPAMFYGMYEQTRDGIEVDMKTALTSDTAQAILAVGFISYAVIMITTCGIWYKKAFLNKQETISNREAFSGRAILITIIGTIGATGLVQVFFTIMGNLFPKLLESFEQIMETSGIGNNPVITIVYACILGPVTEELIFRGLSQSYLHRSNLPVGWVLFLQALFFGIAHMNIMQSSYATLLGIVIGIVRWKLGNVRITCLLHIIYNAFATYGLSLLSELGVSDTAMCIINIVFAVIGIGLIVYLLKQPAREVRKLAAA